MSYITNKQTVVSLGVTSMPVATEPLVTAETLSEHIFMGVTLGGWFYIASFISLLLIIGLNGLKFYKQVRIFFNKDKEEDLKH